MTERLIAILGLMILSIAIGNFYFVFAAFCMALLVLTQAYGPVDRWIVIGLTTGVISSGIVGLIA